MKKLWAFIRHQQGMAVGIIIATAVLIWTYGCQSEVTSITNAPELVTRAELEIEVDYFLKTAEIRFAELDQQDEFKRTIFAIGISLLEGGTLNPAAIAIVIGNILGLGAVIDNVRKRTLIQTLKNSGGASTNANV